MSESRHASPNVVAEFSSAMSGFDVLDRNGELVGTAKRVNLGRTCMLIEAGRWRKHNYAIHTSAVDDVDFDAFAIKLLVNAADVTDAPEYSDFDDQSEAAIARHYRNLTH